MKSYWIWNYGDYEIYHTNLVNSRRQEYGADYPVFWRMSDIERNIKFYSEIQTETKGHIKLWVKGIGHIVIDGNRYKSDMDIPLEPGNHTMQICVSNLNGLPAAFIESDVCATGEGWYTIDKEENKIKAGYDVFYDSAEKNPENFPFAYERKKPVSKEKLQKGILFDFGKEMFGYLLITNAKKEEHIHVSYGESREEATDTDESLIFEDVTGEQSYKLRQRAFRYIFISGSESAEAEADYEYLPLEYKGSFRCNNETVNKIWDLCAYTLHLNSREVFLDGIKRDRWLWSGDAYQSYKFSNYLFFDKEIIKRSILGLRGRDPIVEHINTITDYSLYWIISLNEYYMNFKDKEFLDFIYPRAVSLMDFVKGREDENGLVTKKYNDWIFIDWSELDFTGAVCAEQILYIQANKSMANISKIIGKPFKKYEEKADELIRKVNELYWDDEKGAFIDSFESGKGNVTRHANIFAVLYDIATKEQIESIVKNVLFNEKIIKITTPYFEGYELDVMGKLGHLDYIEDMLLSYWKGMLDLGAATIWEEFDPKLKETEHYSMYNNKYGKSLCHAWGSGPIYLLGKYYLGVYPTSAGFETFEISPNLGGWEFIEGTVPINGGEVKVYLSKNRLEVTASRDGGTLIFKDNKYTLKPGEKLVIAQ